MGQSELTSLARNDVTSLVCGMDCRAGRVDELVTGVIGTIGCIVVVMVVMVALHSLV